MRNRILVLLAALVLGRCTPLYETRKPAETGDRSQKDSRDAGEPSADRDASREPSTTDEPDAAVDGGGSRRADAAMSGGAGAGGGARDPDPDPDIDKPSQPTAGGSSEMSAPGAGGSGGVNAPSAGGSGGVSSSAGSSSAMSVSEVRADPGCPATGAAQLVALDRAITLPQKASEYLELASDGCVANDPPATTVVATFTLTNPADSGWQNAECWLRSDKHGDYLQSSIPAGGSIVVSLRVANAAGGAAGRSETKLSCRNVENLGIDLTASEIKLLTEAHEGLSVANVP